MKISIISSSVRKDRKSHWVALYFKNYIEDNKIGEAKILDLMEYNFPLFDERLKNQSSPSNAMIEFAKEIESADGVIIVTPEYNGGYPASLKNVIDLLVTEWKRKPTSIASVSSGMFGGAQVTTSLLFTLWKIGAWVVPSPFPVAKVQESFNAEGLALDKLNTDKRAKIFLDELVWCMEAGRGMKN